MDKGQRPLSPRDTFTEIDADFSGATLNNRNFVPDHLLVLEVTIRNTQCQKCQLCPGILLLTSIHTLNDWAFITDESKRSVVNN